MSPTMNAQNHAVTVSLRELLEGVNELQTVAWPTIHGNGQQH